MIFAFAKSIGIDTDANKNDIDRWPPTPIGSTSEVHCRRQGHPENAHYYCGAFVMLRKPEILRTKIKRNVKHNKSLCKCAKKLFRDGHESKRPRRKIGVYMKHFKQVYLETVRFNEDNLMKTQCVSSKTKKIKFMIRI